MKKKSNEKKIIIGALLGTVAIIGGFTLSQGEMKFNQEKYVSAEVETQNKLEYKIVDKVNQEDKTIYNIYSNNELESTQIAQLTKELTNKDTKKDYEIFLFNDLQKSNKLKEILANGGSVDNTVASQQVITQESKDEIKITQYYNVETPIESIPTDYQILSVKEKEENTEIEMIVKNITKPEQALSQIEFLGENVKKLNANKNLENLEIKSYCDESKKQSWNYNGNLKNIITYNQYEIIN